MSDNENTPIRLPGSETYWNAYDWGGEIDKQFPGQDGDEFAYAISMSGCGDAPLQGKIIDKLVMVHQGSNDTSDWCWTVRLCADDGREDVYWREYTYATLVAGCDYTGWDCRSWGYWMTGVVAP